MPSVSVNLTDEDLKELGQHRSAKLRELLKERREHKCAPTPDEVEIWYQSKAGAKRGEAPSRWKVHRRKDGKLWLD